MAKRPNFLFFINDQHRVDYLGCSGHPVLKTPHIDFIAARGTRFDALLRGDAGLHAQPLDPDDRAHAVGARRAQQRLAALAAAPTPSSMRCAPAAMPPRWSARAICRISPTIPRDPEAAAAAAGRSGARCDLRGGAEALGVRRAVRPGASDALGAGPRLRHEAAVLRLRARRSLHRARRSGRRPLLRLAQVAAPRCRRAARPQEPAAARLRLPAGVPHADPGGALSDRLHRRQKLRMARPLRRGRAATSRSS